jgi:hypothetical protein
MIQRYPVVRMFEDRSEGIEKAARTVFYVEFLNVVSDRQALPLDSLRFFQGSERPFSFFRGQWDHRYQYDTSRC